MVIHPSREMICLSLHVFFVRSSREFHIIELDYLDDSEIKHSRLSVPCAMSTPATSILSRTSSRESVISEHSFLSPSPPQQQTRRASKLPLPIGRFKTSINTNTPVNHS